VSVRRLACCGLGYSPDPFSPSVLLYAPSAGFRMTTNPARARHSSRCAAVSLLGNTVSSYTGAATGIALPLPFRPSGF
jgi:hypothetical protein